MTQHIQNEAAMVALAKQLAADVQAGDCFALHGNLGAGKSFLARAMMRALGVTDEALPSPTFAIIQEYDAANGLKIAHMDWYRLEDAFDVANLGVDEFFSPPWLTLIEWSERAPELLPRHTKHIHISLDEQDINARFVRIET
ncbi:tRNA (adenosine(37)-N6)-threonylcarbamoyltransferase complex ATPase subunit type 1 TsaE [Ghiorsea bivora]|uniref:tRNA (adenosine(37)-N6)-threonylcarbamoyltransferase complex ATPase subunit type 1 TsaE n=1 Tax=Ghiorsea bivora TaxID=1485545 RepID=UPI0009DD3FBA|nr:tRNA (adenosine(37)-N6)-threonylcarbamoyltransferase complex ATPase subunit type 1 TsaE [Ghiorsea bivora]